MHQALLRVSKTLFFSECIVLLKTGRTVYELARRYATECSNPAETFESAYGTAVRYLFATSSRVKQEGEEEDTEWEYGTVMDDVSRYFARLRACSESLNDKSLPYDLHAWMKHQTHTREEAREYMSCPVLRDAWDDFVSRHGGPEESFKGEIGSFDYHIKSCETALKGGLKGDNGETDEITGLDSWLVIQKQDYENGTGIMKNPEKRKEWEKWFDEKRMEEILMNEFHEK